MITKQEIIINTQELFLNKDICKLIWNEMEARRWR